MNNNMNEHSRRAAASYNIRAHYPKSISVVIPCYNEQEVLFELDSRLQNILNNLGIKYEIVLVDDGSNDNTWNIMNQLAINTGHYKIIRLSRNHGHQIALSCGIDYAKGEVVLVMDADLQDPPELIKPMLEKWLEGYDVVYGKRTERRSESFSKKFYAGAFYRIFRKITGLDVPTDTGDFRLMDRRAVDALKQLREKHRFIRGMVSWIGFNQTPIYYERPARFAGVTKYPFKKSLFLAIDAITSFSYAPLRLASVLGGVISFFSFFYIVIVIILNALGRNLAGYTSMMASMLLLGGVQLLVLGIMGEYIGRVFEQGQASDRYPVN
jgi:glycosyltransferase involved in cell wall biosynthesis